MEEVAERLGGAMSNTPQQQEVDLELLAWGPKNEAWVARGFRRINETLTETGLIPRMHKLFADRGIEETWIVLDCFEPSYGFPIPGVFTRYLLPVEDVDNENVLEWNSGEFLPGLLISEILGLGGRTVLIQIGIDNHDRQRISTRFQLFKGRADQIVSEGGVPEWWNYDYDVIDFTTKYDLVREPEEKLRIANVSENQDYYIRSWIYGRQRPTMDPVVELEYERESDGSVEQLWDAENYRLNLAFLWQAEILGSMVKKTT